MVRSRSGTFPGASSLVTMSPIAVLPIFPESLAPNRGSTRSGCERYT